MPDLPRFVRQDLIAHLPVIFHVPHPLVSKQLGYGEIIQMHIRQLYSIVMSVHMASKSEQPSIIIPQIFLANHIHYLYLNPIILQWPCRIVFIYKDILCLTIPLLCIKNGLMYKSRQFFTDWFFIGFCFHLTYSDDRFSSMLI